MGTYDKEAAVKLLGADDDEVALRNARAIRQVRDGTYFADREAERRRTIEQLAAELAVSPGVRQKVAAMGVRLPEDDSLGAQPVNAPAVEPAGEAKELEPEPVLATDTTSGTSATPRPSSLAQELGLPDDITPDAAAAYYEIARKAAIAYGEWPETTWPFAKAEPSDPVSIAAMVSEFERLERDGGLDEISQRYLTFLRTGSIDDANNFLIDRYARKLIAEVANGRDFEEHRKDAGFPRLSQRGW